MALLIVNSGSSSIKLSYFNGDERKDLQIKGGPLTADHFKGLEISNLIAIGHRVVHGGTFYTSLVQIDDKVLENLEKVTELAPLHNQPAIDAIKACQTIFGDQVPQVAAFDTSFFSFLPPVASTYAIPFELARRYGIKKYGFHGISHAFLWQSFVRQGGNPRSKVITLHLGSGCSAAAIDGGRPLDTSMGFTPDEGLVMATRAGDIDASIVEFLCEHEEMNPKEVVFLLNHYSGLIGVSGVSGDMEALISSMGTKERARFAIDLFVYRIVKYVGSYIAVLGGLDALIFSGGIGENSPKIREKIVQGLRIFGLKIDHQANESALHLPLGKSRKIGDPSSAIAQYVIATDENGFIASEIKKALE